MFTKSFKLALSALALGAVLTSPAQAQRCTNDPLIFTISASYTDPATNAPYTSAIIPDGAGDYSDGQGVTARINLCSGTGDATLLLSTKRSAKMSFQNVVATTSATPAWVTTPASVTLLNVHNILYNYNPAATYSFTTRFGSQLGRPNDDYYFRLENSLAQASTTPSDINANNPCMTSLLNVVHYPATSTSKETWIAWPDSSAPAACTIPATPAQAGALLNTRTSPAQNAGQFSVPFYLTIRRK